MAEMKCTVDLISVRDPRLFAAEQIMSGAGDTMRFREVDVIHKGVQRRAVEITVDGDEDDDVLQFALEETAIQVLENTQSAS